MMNLNMLKLHLIGLIGLVLVFSCTHQKTKTTVPAPSPKMGYNKLTQEWKSYWFDGTAEITSYELIQTRYGEERKGKAVLIFVTEDLLQTEQVKADKRSPKSATVLKRNTTKEFLTGIYPYHIMSSTFSWIRNPESFAKTSLSMQEWCGHSYLQLNNRKTLDFTRHSYFQGEADQSYTLEKTPTEDQLYNQIRLDPNKIQADTLSMLPSLEFLQLNHQPIRAYTALLNIQIIDSIREFEVYYPELKRRLIIRSEKAFPYSILGWEEDIPPHRNIATKILTIKTPYWNLNHRKDSLERKSLQLYEMD